MNRILIVSHATLSKGISEAAKMIAGDSMNIDYISLENGGGITKFKEDLTKYIDNLGDDNLIILADLQGGSPQLGTVDVLSQKGLIDIIPIIVGVNLPLLLSLIFTPDFTDIEELDRIIVDTRTSINRIDLSSSSSSDEDEEL